MNMITEVGFYIVFLLSLGLFLTGYFWKKHQEATILHFFSFGFGFIGTISGHNVGNAALGGVCLGLTLMAAGCAVYRASKSFAEQGGPL